MTIKNADTQSRSLISEKQSIQIGDERGECDARHKTQDGASAGASAGNEAAPTWIEYRHGSNNQTAYRGRIAARG